MSARTDAQRDIARAMSEDELLRNVVDCARTFGWLVHHQRPARTLDGWRTAVQGDAGFVDLVLARNGRLLLVELKREGEGLRPAQQAWRAALEPGTAEAWHDYLLWRPRDWLSGAIEAELRNG